MSNNAHGKAPAILGVSIDALGWDEILQQITIWAAAHESRTICACNVHSLITADTDPDFKKALLHADLSTPDGAPVAWALRHMGFPEQQRINGPDLMWKYAGLAEQKGQAIFLFGSNEQTLAKLSAALRLSFPCLRIAGTHAPPFQKTTTLEENPADTSLINRSGAHVVFVGLGCPKQEKWMDAHRHKINAVMIGVGAAFDYHAGVIKRAPLWWQHHGLEWLYRLCSEPRRLFKRYFLTNTLFVWRLAKQMWRGRAKKVGPQ